MAESQEGIATPGETQVVEKKAAEQPKSRRSAHLKPWQFKKGQSGNPEGKKKGTVSLKKFAQSYIQDLTDEEKLEYLEGLDKDKIWEMAEGKPKQDIEHGGAVTISHVLDSLENERSEASQQGVEDEPLVQDQGQAAEPDPVQAEQGTTALQSEQVAPEHHSEVAPTGVHHG